MTANDSWKPADAELTDLLHGLYHRGLVIGVDDARRVALVFSHAEGWSRARRVRVLKSLLARSDEERLIIEQLAPFLFTATPQPSEVVSSPAPLVPVPMAVPTPSPAAPVPSAGRKIPLSVRWPFLAVLLLALGVLLLGRYWPTYARETVPDPVESTAPVVKKSDSVVLPRVVEAEIDTGPPPLPSLLPFQLGAAASLLLLVPLLLGVRRMPLVRRQEANLQALRDSEGARCYAPPAPAAPPALLSGDALREAAFHLHAPTEAAPAPWLDLRRTVATTVRRAGLLTLVYDTWLTQKSLLFIEDVGPGMARWPELGRQLAEALGRQGGGVAHRFMIGQPGRLYTTPELTAGHDLAQVLAELDQPLVVLLGDGAALDRWRLLGAQPAPWVGLLGQAVWFHPQPLELWGAGACWLAERLRLVPLTGEGLLRLGRSGEGGEAPGSWRPPERLGDRPELALAGIRVMVGEAAYWWLAAGAVLDRAEALTTSLWRALASGELAPLSGPALEKAWTLVAPRPGGGGRLRLPRGSRESLLASLQTERPELLVQVTAWAVGLVERDLARLESPSLAWVQARLMRLRLLNADPSRRGEVREQLRAFAAEGYGGWAQAAAEPQERADWRGLRLVRARRPAGRAWVAAALGVAGLVVCLGAMFFPEAARSLYPMQPDYRFLSDLPVTLPDGSPLLWITPEEPLRFYDRNRSHASVVVDVPREILPSLDVADANSVEYEVGDGNNVHVLFESTGAQGWDEGSVWEIPLKKARDGQDGGAADLPGERFELGLTAPLVTLAEQKRSYPVWKTRGGLIKLQVKQSKAATVLTWMAPIRKIAAAGASPGPLVDEYLRYAVDGYRIFQGSTEIARVSGERTEFTLPAGDHNGGYRVLALSGRGEPLLSNRVFPGKDPGLLEMAFVQVPKGCFQMGSPSGEKERFDSEGPVHEVCLDGFWLGQYEVTQGQWRAVMGSNPSHFKKGDDYPVENVSWLEVQQFIEKLNRQGKTKYRLPSEAEWEYAARAGTRTPFSFGETLSAENQANYDGNYPYGGGAKGPYRASTTAVGSFPANGWGLHDMHGNVWEWVQDVYDEKYYSRSPGENPCNKCSTIEDGNRVLRGGSWNYVARNLRSAVRDRAAPDVRDQVIGFRLVRLPQDV